MKMTNFETLIEKRMMKKKIMIVLVSAFLLLSAFSCGGGNKANSTSEQNEKIVVNVPQFDADSAYLYVKNQVDFGPRVPNTKGHVACGNYLAKQLKDFGAQVTDQYADLIAYNGTLLKARNIIGSYKPESKKRIALFPSSPDGCLGRDTQQPCHHNQFAPRIWKNHFHAPFRGRTRGKRNPCAVVYGFWGNHRHCLEPHLRFVARSGF